MTDFYGRLEDQLVAAGRRRTARRGRWWPAVGARDRAVVARRGRLAVALAAGVVALAAGVGGVAALRPGSPAAPAGHAPSSARPAGDAPAAARPTPPAGTSPAGAPWSPSLRGISVVVRNATTTSGAARAVADLLEQRGATILAVGNAADQTRTQTVVEYVPGAGAKARRVAQVLRVGTIRPRRGPEVGAAPDADVVIDVGADRNGP
jgi:hypothetical protein